MEDIQSTMQHSVNIAESFKDLGSELEKLTQSLKILASGSINVQPEPFVIGIVIFVLACFIGYFVVWRVTPALHSPLMAVTNAISSVIIVGALIAAGGAQYGASTSFGFIGVLLASVNIFGGFVVTQRMLEMFSKKKK